MKKYLFLGLLFLYSCTKSDSIFPTPTTPPINSQPVSTQVFTFTPISNNGFMNNKPIADWSKGEGPSSLVWWDMTGDGSPDKVFYTMSDTSFYLNIYQYNGSSYLRTYNVNDLVSNDSLRLFFKSAIKQWGHSMQTGASLNVVDFNKDSIPDLLFEVSTMESDISSNTIVAYDVLLVSKGWLKYELHVFPSTQHAQMTSCSDFNGDGIPDLWKSSVTINNSPFSSYHSIKYLYKDYTSNEVILSNLGRQDDQGTSYIADLDNNGIGDVMVGERDYGWDLGNGLPGKGPRLLMNVQNGSWTKDVVLINPAYEAKWHCSVTRFQLTQSIAFLDINNDGKKDIILNKAHSNASPQGTTSGWYNPDLRAETIFQIWRNDGNGNFTDITEQWFPNNTEYLMRPLNSAGPFRAPGGGNPNPGDLITGDVDGDGKVDVAFKYYGNIYYKNMGDHFELQRNDNGFGFLSQSYKGANY